MVILPPEMWRNIFAYLDDISDLMSCSEVCKTWLKIIRDDPFLTREMKLFYPLAMDLKEESIEFLNAFPQLKVLIMDSYGGLLFAQSKDEDVQSAMKNIEQVVIKHEYQTKWKDVNVLDGQLPCFPKKVIYDYKRSNCESCHLDQILSLDFDCHDSCVRRRRLVDAYIESAKKLVNLKHLTISSPPCNEYAGKVFASITMAPNLKSVSMAMEQQSPIRPEFWGGPALSVKRLKITYCNDDDLRTLKNDLVKKYPKVSTLIVELYYNKPRELSPIQMQAVLEILSNSFPDLKDLTVNTSFAPQWFNICKSTKEFVKEYVPERVSFKMYCSFKTASSKTWRSLELVKKPFEDLKYYYCGNHPEPYVADTICEHEFLCKDNVMYFPAW